MVHSAAFAPGTFGSTPFLYLMVSLFERQLTGTLVLETSTGAKSAIGFEYGAPIKAKLAEPVARLGSQLVELGYLDESDRERVYIEAKEQGLLLGQYLLQTQRIDAALLEQALRGQLLRKLRWTHELPPTTGYGFYQDQDFLARWSAQGIRVSPLSVIWDLIRTAADPPNLAERVQRCEAHTLRLGSHANLDAFDFDSAERSLVNMLERQPTTVSELRLANLLPEAVLQRLIYVLSITRQVELQRSTESPAPSNVTAPAPAEPSTSHRPAAPGGELSREADEKRQELIALTERYQSLDYYELLGVARDAAGTQIQAAFLGFAKRFHPDKLGPELADLRPASAKLFARITEARQQLADPELRSAYDAKLAQGVSVNADEQHRIQEIVNAATCFQKAEVLLKKRMLAAAEQEARRAYEADPEQADYLALLAWIRASKADSAQELPGILVQLNTAVTMSPQSERAHFYRAQVLTRLGRNLEALSDYRFVASKNPHNIDAQREIRLWEMRQQKPSAAPAQQTTSTPTSKGGMLGKLFKRRID